jgi:hypothetical protein
MNRHWYDHGLPFTKKLSENLDDMKERISLNKAALMVIDGQVGEGKTTLAIHCGDYLNGAYECTNPKAKLENRVWTLSEDDKLLDLKDQIALGGGDFTKKLKLCYGRKLGVLIYDEAGDFNKRGSLTKFNAMINRVFETFRTFNIIVILCLPSLKSLDNTLYDKGILRLTLHCQDRTQKYGHFKGYSLYRSNYLQARMDKIVVKQQAYGMVRPNFYGEFLDLPPERAKELDKITTQGKTEILEEGEILYHGFLTKRDLMLRVDRSMSWVHEKIKELGIKPVKTFKQRNYFSQDVVERLAGIAVYEKKKEKEGKTDAEV